MLRVRHQAAVSEASQQGRTCERARSPSSSTGSSASRRYSSACRALRVQEAVMWWNNPDAWERRSSTLTCSKTPEPLPTTARRACATACSSSRSRRSSSALLARGRRDPAFDAETATRRTVTSSLTKVPTAGSMADGSVPEKTSTGRFGAVWRGPGDRRSSWRRSGLRPRPGHLRARQSMVRSQLSKSDLLLSMITAQVAWQDARDEVYAFVDRLNERLATRNDFDKDFVMKSCLVLATFRWRTASRTSTTGTSSRSRQLARIKSAVEQRRCGWST